MLNANTAKQRARSIALIVGGAITVVGCGYFLFELVRYPVWEATDLSAWSLSIQLFPLAVAYSASTLVMALAWWLLVDVFDPGKMLSRRGVAIYGASQLAKYLPTNTLHLLGRYAMSRDVGVSRSGIVLSTVLESVSLIAIAALLVASFGVNEAMGSLPKMSTFVIAVAVGASLAIPLVIVWFNRVVGKSWLPSEMSELRWIDLQRSWVGVQLLCLLFFLVTAWINLQLVGLTAFSVVDEIDFGFLLAVAGGAWLAGTLAPGAPGGLGVRESIMVLGFSRVMAPGDAVFVATTFRVVTVVGDLLAFAVAQFILHVGRRGVHDK